MSYDNTYAPGFAYALIQDFGTCLKLRKLQCCSREEAWWRQQWGGSVADSVADSVAAVGGKRGRVVPVRWWFLTFHVTERGSKSW